MVPVSAREAVEYAIDAETLRLLAVVLTGWVLLSVGAGLIGSGPFPRFHGLVSILQLVEWVAGTLLALVGLLALYGGLVALLYKVIVDALAAADGRDG